MKSSNDEADTANLPWPEPKLPRAEITAAIRRECTRDLGQCRRVSAATRALWCAGVFTLMFGGLLLLGQNIPKPEGFARAALFGMVGWGMALIAATLYGLSLPPGRRTSRNVRLVLAFGTPVLFIALLPFAARTSVPVGEFIVARQHGGWALGCGLTAVLLGGVASLAVMYVFRKTDPLTPRISGALAGVFGGLTSAVAVGCACPSTEAWHLLSAHGLIVIALAVGGAMLGRRWLSP